MCLTLSAIALKPDTQNTVFCILKFSSLHIFAQFFSYLSIAMASSFKPKRMYIALRLQPHTKYTEPNIGKKCWMHAQFFYYWTAVLCCLFCLFHNIILLYNLYWMWVPIIRSVLHFTNYISNTYFHTRIYFSSVDVAVTTKFIKNCMFFLMLKILHLEGIGLDGIGEYVTASGRSI